MNLSEFSDGQLWPKTGTNLYAEECWTQSRVVNAGDSFDLIYDLSNVKRGDVIVLSSSPISETGHIAFADTDYNGSASMNLLGQNQVDPNPYTGHIPTVTSISVSPYFLGAFRLKSWTPTPPTPSVTTGRNSRLPLIMITRRLLNNGNMI